MSSQTQPLITDTARRAPVSWSGRLREIVGRWLVAVGNGMIAPAGKAAGGRRLEDVAAEGGDRFASLASMIPGVVYQRVVSPEGGIRYTYLSEGAREVFGVSPEEVMRDPEALFKTFSDEYKASFRQRLIAASQSLTKWDVEASIVSPDGSIRYTHAIAKPERLADGSVLWTGLILDATRIKHVEEELKAANRLVEAANQAKSLFLANMSHEIRTPMNGVLGMAEVLLKTDLSGRQHRLLSTLRHSAKTLLGIINDVLDISRIEAGHFNLESEDFNLYFCLEDVIELCAGSAYKKGLELSLIVDGELPETVKGDAGRLRQVLINLIGNAIKFTLTGRALLRVSAVAEPGNRTVVKFEVVDTGIGIAPAAKEKLFAPFAQADTSISRKFGGTGLGLAITRHLVTLMGGQIELHSELGHGTTVSFELPFEITHDNAADAPSEQFQLDGKRVLIVDDRSSAREAMASLLKGARARLDFASSEDEALASLHNALDAADGFALVIVDRVRPNADSSEFCNSVRSDNRLTGLPIVHFVPMNWRAGSSIDQYATAVLAKPVRRVDLHGAVSKLLAGAVSGDPAHRVPDERQQVEAVVTRHLGMHVLLAEDNPVNQEVAQEYLTSLGCTVVVAQNGQEAIEALSTAKFDIVMMDCQMPELDGLSATRSIRAQETRDASPPIPIIAVTANAYESDRQEAMAAGMNDYLTKPFNDTELAAMLQKWKSATVLPAAA